MSDNRRQKRITIFLLLFYLAVLTWIILFKMQTRWKYMPYLRGVNLIPFAGSVIINGKMDWNEIIQNVLIFVPFGLYMSMVKPKWRLCQRVLPVAGVSLLFEVLQYILAIGATDITDLIGNTLGGVIGCMFYWIVAKGLKDKTNKVLNILAMVGSIGIALLMGLLLIMN